MVNLCWSCDCPFKKPPVYMVYINVVHHMLMSVKKLTVHIEERLLWKLLAFCGFNQADPELERLDECSFDSQRSVYGFLNHMHSFKWRQYGPHVCNGATMYTKSSLNRPTMGPTLNGPFKFRERERGGQFRD